MCVSVRFEGTRKSLHEDENQILHLNCKDLNELLVKCPEFKVKSHRKHVEQQAWLAVV